LEENIKSEIHIVRFCLNAQYDVRRPIFRENGESITVMTSCVTWKPILGLCPPPSGGTAKSATHFMDQSDYELENLVAASYLGSASSKVQRFVFFMQNSSRKHKKN
jgi:hypothetical protein